MAEAGLMPLLGPDRIEPEGHLARGPAQLADVSPGVLEATPPARPVVWAGCESVISAFEDGRSTGMRAQLWFIPARAGSPGHPVR